MACSCLEDKDEFHQMLHDLSFSSSRARKVKYLILSLSHTKESRFSF